MKELIKELTQQLEDSTPVMRTNWTDSRLALMQIKGWIAPKLRSHTKVYNALSSSKPQGKVLRARAGGLDLMLVYHDDGTISWTVNDAKGTTKSSGNIQKVAGPILDAIKKTLDIDEEVTADLVMFFEEMKKGFKTPSYMRRCVVDVIDQGKPKDAAFAICTKSMQKAGHLKSGPGGQKETKKGETRKRHFAAKKDQKGYDKRYKALLKKESTLGDLSISVGLGLSEAEEDPELTGYIDDITDTIVGDRKVSAKDRDQLREIVTKEVKKKTSELEESLLAGLIAVAIVGAIIAAAVVAVASVSGALFQAVTGKKATKKGIKEATKEAQEGSNEVVEKAEERKSKSKKPSSGDSGGSGLPSKKLGPDKYEYKGKKGKWRTAANGDRIFFPDDKSGALAGARTKENR